MLVKPFKYTCTRMGSISEMKGVVVYLCVKMAFVRGSEHASLYGSKKELFFFLAASALKTLQGIIKSKGRADQALT